MKSALDRAIEQYGSNPNKSQKNYIDSELAHISMLADLDEKLQKYKSAASSMNSQELRSEKHDSKRLGEHMRASGKPKPDDRVDAHAIVCGGHKESAVLRALMARFKVRIDDPDNGCWLPRRTIDTPHWAFPRAVPHSRIHRSNYFLWLRNQLLPSKSNQSFRIRLQNIENMLQNGTFPPEVMLRKGDGVDRL